MFGTLILADDSASPASPANWAAALPRQADVFGWAQNLSPAVAGGLLVGGIVCLFFGYRVFKGLVVVNAIVFGVYLGMRAAEAWVDGGDLARLLCAVAGGILFGAIAWPAMKYAVAATGAIVGAVLGNALWQAMGFQPGLEWAGSVLGLIAMGLLSFALFRTSIMLYTSLQGGVMIVLGMLGLLLKSPQIGSAIQNHLDQPLLLPVAIVVPAVVGWVFQFRNLSSRTASKKLQ